MKKIIVSFYNNFLKIFKVLLWLVNFIRFIAFIAYFIRTIICVVLARNKNLPSIADQSSIFFCKIYFI